MATRSLQEPQERRKTPKNLSDLEPRREDLGVVVVVDGGGDFLSSLRPSPRKPQEAEKGRKTTKDIESRRRRLLGVIAVDGDGVLLPSLWGIQPRQ